MRKMTLLDIKMQHTPEQFGHYLRQMGDVFWWEKDKFWVVTSHEYAKSILISNDYTCDRSPFFISQMPNIGPDVIMDFFSVISKMMVMSDAPQHTVRRRICYDGFTNRTLHELEPLVQKTIEKQIRICIEKGRMDVVEDLAKVVPSTILADFFHIPEDERNLFYEWSNNMTQFFGGSSQYRNEDGVKVNESAKNLRNYFIDLIIQRRREPKNDFLSILLANQKAFQLSDDEIISQAIMMLVAGQVTTTDQFCNNIYTIMITPGGLESLQSDHIQLDLAINELNRLDPAVSFIFRVAKIDTLIGTQRIKAGDVIFISTHAANRDHRAFDNPDLCLLSRKNNKHISYGFGSHYCIGAKLAQLEMINCLRCMIRTFTNLRFADDDKPVRKHHSLAFSGFEKLPLVFDIN
ncbi:Biotin biosynthesis cytochrome P450 [Aquicella siphonis]|uniref:Biotin biosynthesis cytochrome P450 n=1 Tax=Aquicella siphonis TaxID=254247 RepID=A0A5E4PJL1_9COXI|nr:cytochrome P450 [Aquicella siphonis]VVC77154.1 Biotin biosynthesis cytochrome P450 [Aquicella siphonis]